MNKIWHELTETGCQSCHYLSGRPPRITVADSGAAASKMAVAVSRLCHGDCVLQTGSVAHLWAFPIRCLSD